MKTLTYLVVVIATAAFFLIALGHANDSAARRAYAQAAIIREQSQARQDLLAAALPYIVFGSVVIFIAALGGIAIYALSRQPDHAPPTRIIETRTILILQPGQHSKREIYKLLSGGTDHDTY